MAFNLRYYGNFRSLKKDQFWRVEISENNFSGQAEEVLLTANPLSVTWEKQGDDFYEVVKASEANCSIFCTEQFKFTNLFTGRARQFRMDIFRNTVLYWRGYVVPDNYSEAFSAPPYHVEVKAVDGFANLDNVPFLAADGKQHTGRKSLLELIQLCVDSLELDLDFSDWFDLYPEGADEGLSALGQIYLNMSDIYLANQEPTMRDILEICLKPMGGQIFQSSGAINVRRIVALRDSVRPLSYFNIARIVNEKWLITADGKGLVDENGNRISVIDRRERLDDMWDGDELVKNTNTLSIAPAIRYLRINYDSAVLSNFGDRLNLDDPESWNTTNTTLMRKSRFEYVQNSTGRGGRYTRRIINYLRVVKTTSAEDASFYYDIPVDVDARPMRIDFDYYQIASELSLYKTGKFCIMSVPESGDILYLNAADGTWTTSGTAGVDYWEQLENSYQTELHATAELPNIPASGSIRIKFDISGFVAENGRVSGDQLQLYGWELSLGSSSSEDTTENSVSYERIVDVNCTADLELDLPVVSYNQSPNLSYSYTLYYVDYEGNPIATFHTLGKRDSASLLEQMVRQALQFHSKSQMVLSGDIRSGKHIDMNTVIVDDTYLGKSFYINAQEVDCRGDNFNVEMRELVGDSLSVADDGDFHRVELPGTISSAIQVEGYIIYTTNTRVVYALNSYSGESIRLFAIEATDTIYPSGQFFVVKSGQTYKVYYPNGVLAATYISSYTGSVNGYFMLDKNIFYMADGTSRRGHEEVKVSEILYLTDSRVNYLDQGLATLSSPYPTSLWASEGVLVMQHNGLSKILDLRLSDSLQSNSALTEVVAINDAYIANSASGIKIYKRNALALERITEVASISTPQKFALGKGEAAYYNGTITRILLPDSATSVPEVGEYGSAGAVIGLFYVDSTLWVVRDNGAYRLCE